MFTFLNFMDIFTVCKTAYFFMVKPKRHFVKPVNFLDEDGYTVSAALLKYVLEMAS